MVTRDLWASLVLWVKKVPSVLKERAECLVCPGRQGPLVREVHLETSRKSSDLLGLLAPRERLEILEFLVKTERRVREEVMVTRAPKVWLVRMEPMDCEVQKATPDLPVLLVVMVGWGRQAP